MSNASDRVTRILAATYDVPEGCFPRSVQQVEAGDPLPSPLDQLTHWVSELSVRDGHAQHVRLPASTFLERGLALRAISPFRSVSLTGAAGHETAILHHPATAELTGLALDSRPAKISHEALVDALITAPSLPALRHLAFDYYWVDRRTLEAMVVAPIAASLRCVHADLGGVIDSNLDDDGDSRFDIHWVNDDGKAVIALADRYPFLAPAVEHIRKMAG